MAEFEWCPQVGTVGDVKFTRATAQFGDGYSQTVAFGINNRAQTWPLQFTGEGSYIAQIRDFLDAHYGAQSFTWVPPLGVEGRFRAEDYTLQAHGMDVYTLSVTFQQVFGP